MKPKTPSFAGRKHSAESNKKRSETIKKMYADGVAGFGFKQKYTTDEQRGEARKASRLKTKYGLSKEVFNLMLAGQNGKCLICDKAAVAVDHNHRTQEVRGILCAQCNTGIGFFEDNPEFLMRAAAYLQTENRYMLKDILYVANTDGIVYAEAK